MKKERIRQKNKLIQLWFIIGVIAGFAAIVFFALTYLNQKVLCDINCRIKNEVNLLLVMLSLSGLFVGSLTYYFISEGYEKKISKIHTSVTETLRFLDKNERQIIKSLINAGGKLAQSELTKRCGLSRVKVSRYLNKLKQKEIINKIPKGMTNIIELDEKIKEVFIN